MKAPLERANAAPGKSGDAAGGTNGQQGHEKHTTPHALTRNRSRSWRWRCCPACHVVRPTGEFQVAGSFRPGWDEYGTMKRRCPACGRVAGTSKFQVVRERRQEVGR